MPALGHHVMFRSDDDRVLAPGVPQRRALARSVLRIGGSYGLLAFGSADNHLHAVVLVDRALAGEFAHRLACSLRWALELPVPFFPTRFKAIEDQTYMKTAFNYALGQRNRHGIASDPFLDASSLPDLLGLRPGQGDLITRVREHLPRVRRSDLLRHLGPDDLEPAEGERIAGVLAAGGSGLLLDAAAAVGALPALVPRQRTEPLLLAALIQALAPLLAARALCAVVGRSPSHVRALRAVEVPPPIQRALRLQIALRAWLLAHHPEALPAAGA
ncbi:MAG: hypothetical protein ABIO70_35680 [Pseudomonadota bacterium]